MRRCLAILALVAALAACGGPLNDPTMCFVVNELARERFDVSDPEGLRDWSVQAHVVIRQGLDPEAERSEALRGLIVDLEVGVQALDSGAPTVAHGLISPAMNDLLAWCERFSR